MSDGILILNLPFQMLRHTVAMKTILKITEIEHIIG